MDRVEIDRRLREIAQASRNRDIRDGCKPRRCPFWACIWILGGKCQADFALPTELSSDPLTAFGQGASYAHMLDGRCLKAVTMAINAGYGELEDLDFVEARSGSTDL